MNVFEKSLVTVLACNALFILVVIPLALRKVPPNPVYGYRTCATLSDEILWYAANAYFAWRFILSAILSAVAAVTLYAWQGLAPQDYMQATIVLLVAPVIVTGMLTGRFVRLRKEAGH